MNLTSVNVKEHLSIFLYVHTETEKQLNPRKIMQAQFVISDGIFVFIFENKRFPIKYKDVSDIIRYSLINLTFLDTKNSNRIKVSSKDNNLQIEIENYQFNISFGQIDDACNHNSEITIYDKNTIIQTVSFESKPDQMPSRFLARTLK